MPELLKKEEFRSIESKAKALAKHTQKNICQAQLQQFQSECSQLKPRVFDNINYMLSELCVEVQSACGRVRDKQRKLDIVYQTLYKIESCGVEKDRSTISSK